MRDAQATCHNEFVVEFEQVEYVPARPDVYLFKDGHGNGIYVAWVARVFRE